jgi:hypothetical protein
MLNKLNATTPAHTHRDKIYKRVLLNLAPKNIHKNSTPGIKGTMIFNRIALIHSKKDISNIGILFIF